jgi:hypothetical protein
MRRLLPVAPLLAAGTSASSLAKVVRSGLVSLVLLLAWASVVHAGPRHLDGFPENLSDLVATADGSAYVVGSNGKHLIWRIEPGGIALPIDLPSELAAADRLAWSESDRILWVSSHEAVACRRPDGA